MGLNLPGDERFYVSTFNASQFPDSTSVAQAKFYDDDEVTISGTACSASLVGDSTALSAAHCFYDHDNQAPYEYTAVAAGVVSFGVRDNYNPTSAPEWSVTSQTRSTPTQLWWDFDVFWNVAWESTGNFEYDMGAIEFLNQTPGAGNQLSLCWSSTESHYTGILVHMSAYDSLSYEADAMGLTDRNTNGHADPTLRTRDYGANNMQFATGNDKFLVTTTIDFTPGSSGSCLFQRFMQPPPPKSRPLVLHGHHFGYSKHGQRWLLSQI